MRPPLYGRPTRRGHKRHSHWGEALLRILRGGKWGLCAGIVGLLMVFGLYALSIWRPIAPRFTAQADIVIATRQPPFVDDATRPARESGPAFIELPVASDIDLLTSHSLAARVLSDTAPAFVATDPPTTKARKTIRPQEVAELLAKFQARAAPQSRVVRLSFTDNNARIAEERLSRWIGLYGAFRDEILLDQDPEQGSDRAGDIAARIQALDAQILAAQSGFASLDVSAEWENARQLYQDTERALLEVTTHLAEIGARRQSLEAALEHIPDEIILASETKPARALGDLETERLNLLSIFQPGTPQIRAIEARIGRLRAQIARDGPPSEASRVEKGPNRVAQELKTDLLRIAADEAAALAKRAVLRVQQEKNRDALNQLSQSEPEIQRLIDQKQRAMQQLTALRAWLSPDSGAGDGVGRSTIIRFVTPIHVSVQTQSITPWLWWGLICAAVLLGVLIAFWAGSNGDPILDPKHLAAALDLPILGIFAPAQNRRRRR